MLVLFLKIIDLDCCLCDNGPVFKLVAVKAVFYYADRQHEPMARMDMACSEFRAGQVFATFFYEALCFIQL